MGTLQIPPPYFNYGNFYKYGVDIIKFLTEL